MYACLLLGVGILNKVELGFRCENRDVGNGDEIVYPLAVVLQVKTGILKCSREIDNRLTDFVYLLLGRDLGDMIS